MKIINELTYAQRERLIFIDLCLNYLGEVSRAELLDKFGTGLAAATRDFSAYKDLAPNNMELVHKTKTYHRTDSFKALFEHDSDLILQQLSSGLGMSYPNQLHQACINTVNLVNPPAKIIATVMRAIIKNQVLKCQYISLSSGLKKRVIIPHTLVNNGKRWHVRVYDRESNTFKDFVITRFKQLKIVDSEISIKESKTSDNQWNRIVDLTLIPHPRASFPEAIELDYAMEKGELNIAVRAALVGYMLNQWNVDCSVASKLNPHQYQLALKERESIFAVENAHLAPGYQEIEK